MRERPIIFSGPMVRAVLEGRKTQTRRVMRPQPAPEFLARGIVDVVPQWPMQDGVRFFLADGMSELVRCPCGQPGDRLYWANEPIEFIGINSLPKAPRQVGTILSLFDGSQREVSIPGMTNLLNGRKVKRPVLGRWQGRRLPIEWARDWRWPVTEIRVERVQKITPSDCEAEGIEGKTLASPVRGQPYEEYRCDDGLPYGTPVDAFRDLWDSLNAKRGYGWEANPWVWVVEFRRMI